MIYQGMGKRLGRGKERKEGRREEGRKATSEGRTQREVGTYDYEGKINPVFTLKVLPGCTVYEYTLLIFVVLFCISSTFSLLSRLSTRPFAYLDIRGKSYGSEMRSWAVESFICYLKFTNFNRST